MALDVPSIQRALAADRLDGWLLYDFQGSNPIAQQLTGLAGGPHMTTRRWYYLIPATGEPRALVHAIEQHNLDHIGNTTHLVSRVLPGADCTIEGVEKAKWIRALAARGCKKFQGFGIARPGPYGPPPVLDLGPERSPRPGNGPKRGRKQEKPPARHRDRGSQDRRGGARRTSRRR